MEDEQIAPLQAQPRIRSAIEAFPICRWNRLHSDVFFMNEEFFDACLAAGTTGLVENKTYAPPNRQNVGHV